MQDQTCCDILDIKCNGPVCSGNNFTSGDSLPHRKTNYFDIDKYYWSGRYYSRVSNELFFTEFIKVENS